MKYLSLIYYQLKSLTIRHGIGFVLNPVNGQLITTTAVNFTGCRGTSFSVELE